MRKRIIALLLALILTVGLLPTVALAAEGGETPTTGTGDVKNGYYEGTIWKEGPLNQGKLPTGVESVSKTAKPTSNPNEYEVTLEVVLKKTESQEKPGAAATVLVLDHSGSMNGCADCNSSKNGGNYYHTRSCKHSGKVTTNQTRMYAATQAVLSFIKTYSGRFDENGQETTIADLNLGRWVCLVWFNETGGLTGGSKWVDVSNKSGYQTATNTDGWKAHDGTNLDCGLRLADHWLKQSPVASINKSLKNVIVLSDGEPTYYLSSEKNWFGESSDITIGQTDYYLRHNGKSCNEKTYKTTKSSATTLQTSASLYTVCFGASDNKINDYDKNGDQEISVGEYLNQKIATQPKAGTTEKFAYDAADADALNTAFAAISKTIVSGLSTGTVKDSLPDGITATGMSGEMTWKLDEDFTAAEPVTTTEDGRKVTTYKYTKTYTVTIDPENVNLKKTADGYAPLNEETTLTVTVDGKEEKIPFPIPAGKVTPKEYTVKGIIDNNGTVNSAASPYTETVESGKTSKAMTFVPATGYVIDTITEKIGSAEPKSITVSDANKNSYTYDAKTVTADITVTVTTKKRADLSYTIKYVEEGTTNEIKPADTVGNQEFGAEINVAEMHKPAITGYTYNSCSPIGKLTIGTDENLITLYYTKNKHNITYVYAENSPNTAPSLDSYNETDILYGAPKTRKGAPTLDGWTFNGWTTGDVDVAADGTFTMPDKNVTFTGSWTQRATATISYVVVGPAGCGTVTPASETPYVDADANAVSGSEATATDSYRFVGWYAEEDCTTLLTADSHYTPTKTGDNWTGATYYAKFEAIPKPDADDLPKVDVICMNTVMGHDTQENNPLLMNTYTVGETQYDAENGIYTCEVTLNTILGYIGNYIVTTPGYTHTDDPEKANVTTITLKYENQSWKNETGNFKIYVICDTAKFDVTYTWTGLDDATFESAVKPELPLKAKVTKGDKHTVDTDYKAGDIRVATNGDKYRFSGWSTTDANIVSGEITNIQNNIALTGTWTKLGSGTFDLNDKIFKVFDEADGSRDIPRSSYTFEVKVTRLDKETNELTDEKYTGTVTLDGATGAATSSFEFSNQITFHTGGDYRFLVEEKPNTVTTLSSDEQIDYDDAVYYLYVTVSDDLKTINYRFEHVLVITSVEEEPAALDDQKIFFYNYYFAEKDPDKLYLDFSKYVQKELTATGSKTASDVDFRVNVKGGENLIAKYSEGEEEVSADANKYNTVLGVRFDSITGGTVETKKFTGNTVEIDHAGHYYFDLSEEKGTRTGVTYDETTYTLYVTVEEQEGSLVITNVHFYDSNDGEYDASQKITFHNTIDTGRDDYIPIIIPTIINKDTGMLNKTDHFAYVIGYPDGTVHPNGQITRAEVATIFFRLLRDEVRDGAFTTSNTYSDVAYGKWYNNPISTMSALGIITGYPDGTFKPNKPITRAEFAAIAARFDETQSGKSATFSDVIGHWAAKEIGIAYYNDWIKGYPDGTFKPDQNITRAEAMTLINRVLERKPESPADLLTNMNKWTDNMDTSKWYYLDVQEATNSHGYTRKTFNYELWRQMLPDPDWSRYER